MASRNSFAPQVMAYWFTSSRMASAAARFNSAGAGKSGKPCERLTAPWRMASRVISRMTDSVKRAAFCDTRLFVEAAGLVIVNLTASRANYPQATAMLAHSRAAGQTRRRPKTQAKTRTRTRAMADGGKCPLGKNAWLATFLVVAFVLIFLSRKLG